MRILIIGNKFHQFIKYYVQALKNNVKELDLVIDILSPQFHYKTDKSDSLFNKVYDLKFNSKLNKIRAFRGVVRQILFHKAIKHLSSYDIIHVHYVEDVLAREASYFSSHIKGKVIVTIWGSDFLRASEKKRRRMLPLFKRADKISIASEQVMNEFKAYYKDIAVESKLYTCYFGLQPLENLEKLEKAGITKTESKKVLKLDNKIVITIGYNASKLQRHIEIISYIEKNFYLKKYRDQVIFLFPLTYPDDVEYKKQLKDKLSEFTFHFVVLEDFLQEDKIAHLRNATDIFIQLQTTDMLSGSMLEHLAAKSIVITGAWLPYGNLKRWGIKYNTIKDISEVAEELKEVLENFDNYCQRCLDNNNLVLNLFKWEKVIGDWYKLYN